MILNSNTILYCHNWDKTVSFYRKILQLETLMESDWFVEFNLGGNSRLSVANDRRSSIKSGGGKGVTISLEVGNLDNLHEDMELSGAKPGSIIDHPWGARVFFLFDPEGHRIEFWEKK